MAFTDIDNPELYFQVKLYTGNGSTQTITYDNTDADLDADMIWLKARNHAYSHQLFDTVRGVTKLLNPEAAEAEQTLSGITAFGTDSFNIGSDAGTNGSSKTYVAWCWKESATAGFDIVSWSGTGSAKTESHSLSAVPHFMWNKNRADATQHNIYHHKNTAAPETEIIYLNLTNATADDNAFWNDTAPTSSVFSVGADNGANGSSDTMITYLWSEKQGFSKFGKYTGNGNADGAFVYTGFRPAWLLIKHTSSAESWWMFDNKRSASNVANDGLLANANNTEYSDNATFKLDLLSNGFKLRNSDGALNGSATYIYMAFAEAPFVNSNGVPCNAR